jgi:hypothetical protein
MRKLNKFLTYFIYKFLYLKSIILFGFIFHLKKMINNKYLLINKKIVKNKDGYIKVIN